MVVRVDTTHTVSIGRPTTTNAQIAIVLRTVGTHAHEHHAVLFFSVLPVKCLSSPLEIVVLPHVKIPASVILKGYHELLSS